VISAQAHAAILRRVASTAIDDARAAWRKARASPNEKRIRAAFRSCVFAARALRRAAGVLPHDAPQMIEEAKKLDSAAEELKARLVRIVEGFADPAPASRG
jgi:hypothetical protein